MIGPTSPEFKDKFLECVNNGMGDKQLLTIFSISKNDIKFYKRQFSNYIKKNIVQKYIQPKKIQKCRICCEYIEFKELMDAGAQIRRYRKFGIKNLSDFKSRYKELSRHKCIEAYDKEDKKNISSDNDKIVYPSKGGNPLEYPVFLFTPGKVGQMSVERYLKNALMIKNLIAIHSLRHKTRADGILSKKNENIRLNRANAILSFLSNTDKKVDIITIVRDPLARNISAFSYSNSVYTDMKISTFLEEFDHKWIIDWYDNEFLNFLNIDIYKYKFDKEKKWLIIRDNRYNILILRTENLNKTVVDAISNFMMINAPKFNIKINVQRKKSYRSMLDNVRFNYDFIVDMYNNKYVNHFYSKKEKEAMISRWLGQALED